MNTPHGNPFVLPGMGHGATDQNPLLASMEMMRQAWQNMSSAGVFQQPVGPSDLTTEQLDKRIADMRAVESWLRLNLSMLSSSIQALEVQRATLSTLKSYMGFAPQPQGDSSVPSPLDIALGIKPSGQAKIKSAKGKDAESDESGGAEPLSDAAQAWWGMLQQQFNTLAAATAASMQAPTAAAEPTKPAASKPTAAAPAKKAPRKRAASPRKPRTA